MGELFQLVYYPGINTATGVRVGKSERARRRGTADKVPRHVRGLVQASRRIEAEPGAEASSDGQLATKPSPPAARAQIKVCIVQVPAHRKPHIIACLPATCVDQCRTCMYMRMHVGCD